MTQAGGRGHDELTEAARALRAGRLVAIPTETVYGLAADAGNERAVASVYELKGRPVDHPLIVHVSTAARARQWGRFDAAANKLADAFWPGPMTLICARQDGMPDFACAGHSTIGLRVPSHPVAQSLLQAFESLGGLGVAAPSANRFGRISPTRSSHIRDDYGDKSPLILDGGQAEVGVESTIIDVSTDRVRILRPGAIQAARIAGVLGLAVSDIGLPADAERPGQSAASAVPAAPGTLAAHYAPKTPLTLVPAHKLAASLRARLAQTGRLAVYSIKPPFTDKDLDGRPIVWRQMSSNASALAFELYDELRYLDSLEVDELIVEAPPAHDSFAAIVDRLTRAQTGSGQTDS